MPACSSPALAPIAETVASDFHENVFDALPTPLFIVDHELGIIDFNAAAATMCAPSVFDALHPKTGEALQCAFAEGGACGKTAACANCAIRNSVLEALEGSRVCRRAMHAPMRRNGALIDNELLITTAPFRDGDMNLALLVVENLTEMLATRPFASGRLADVA